MNLFTDNCKLEDKPSVAAVIPLIGKVISMSVVLKSSEYSFEGNSKCASTSILYSNQ